MHVMTLFSRDDISILYMIMIKTNRQYGNIYVYMFYIKLVA